MPTFLFWRNLLYQELVFYLVRCPDAGDHQPRRVVRAAGPTGVPSTDPNQARVRHQHPHQALSPPRLLPGHDTENTAVQHQY